MTTLGLFMIYKGGNQDVESQMHFLITSSVQVPKKKKKS